MAYKINFYSTFGILFVFTILFIILYFHISDEFNWLTFSISFLLFIVIEVCYFFIKKMLVEIIVNEDSNSIVLRYKFLFIKNYLIEFNITDLFFSYKDEIGAKGVKSKEFRLYNKRKEIILKIGKGFDGWTKDTIQRIVSDFKTLKIKEIE